MITKSSEHADILPLNDVIIRLADIPFKILLASTDLSAIPRYIRVLSRSDLCENTWKNGLEPFPLKRRNEFLSTPQCIKAEL